MEEKKVIDVEVTGNKAEEVKENKINTCVVKAKTGIKKHWKAVVGAVLVGLAGVAIGCKCKGNSEDSDDGDTIIDIDSYEDHSSEN